MGKDYLKGKSKPDYEILDFYDLLAILRRDFGVEVNSEFQNP